MNKDHVHENKKVFNDLVTHLSGRILPLDADLSNKTVRPFRELVKPEKMALHIKQESHHAATKH